MQTAGLVLLSIGAFLQVVSGYWDVYSHRATFRIFDPWWNPAHLSIYTGFLIALVGTVLSLRRSRSLINAPVRLGSLLAGIGVAVEITAGTWNEIYHRLYVSEPPIAPAHALLVVGMLILITGTIIGLSVMLAVATESKEGYSKLVKKIILVSLLVSYSAIWLLSAGSTMYVAGVYRNVGGYFGAAVGLAWITPMVMIPAMRSVDRFGTATSIGLSYAIVNFVFLVGYLYEELYLPLGVSSAFALDLAYFGAKRVSSPRTAAMLVGLLSGPLLLVTYYPFTPSIVTVQWTESLRLTLLASTVAGFFGGITGYAAVDGTRSLILKLSSRTAQ